MNPLQQTALWQNFLRDLGETTFFQSGDHWHFLAVLKRTPFGPYLYCPYGPVIESNSALKPAYQALHALGKTHKAIFIRIEPTDAFSANFLRPSSSSRHPSSKNQQNSSNPHDQRSPHDQHDPHGPHGPHRQHHQHDPHNSPLHALFPHIRKTLDLNPADTLVLDLTPDQTTILRGFTSSNRNRYNTIAKKGLTVTTSQSPADIAHLVRLQSTVARTKHFNTFSADYLKTELAQPFTTLYLVHSAGKVIAASLFFDHAGTRYYMQSAADPAASKLAPTVALLSTAIFDAKAAGLTAFDFWGIAPENASKSHSWQGFTAFKQSFGGTRVAYCGTHDLVLCLPAYHSYQILRKLNRFARKLLHIKS